MHSRCGGGFVEFTGEAGILLCGSSQVTVSQSLLEAFDLRFHLTFASTINGSAFNVLLNSFFCG